MKSDHSLSGLWRIMMAIAGVLLVAPSLFSDLLALAIVTPVLLQQITRSRRELSAT